MDIRGHPPERIDRILRNHTGYGWIPFRFESFLLSRIVLYRLARKTPSFEGGDISAIARQGD
jgi:hypothetical protein